MANSLKYDQLLNYLNRFTQIDEYDLLSNALEQTKEKDANLASRIIVGLYNNVYQNMEVGEVATNDRRLQGVVNVVTVLLKNKSLDLLDTLLKLQGSTKDIIDMSMDIVDLLPSHNISKTDILFFQTLSRELLGEYRYFSSGMNPLNDGNSDVRNCEDRGLPMEICLTKH